MVLFFNILPFLLVMLGFLVAWKTKSNTVTYCALAFIVGVLILYPKIQPSYLPKGTVQRTEVPEFAPSNAEIDDRNRKPVPTEVRQAHQEKAYKEGTGF